MEKTRQIKKWTPSSNRWLAVLAFVLLCPLSVLAQSGSGDIFLGTRAADGTWSNFSDILYETGRPTSFADVSMSATGEWLHLVGQTVDGGLWPPGGQIWYTIRVPGRWRCFGDQCVYRLPYWEPFTNVEAQAG